MSEGVVTLEQKHMSAAEEPYVLYTAGAEQQSLLQHKHQDSCDENHKAHTQIATDGSDPKTSVQQALDPASRDQPGCSGGVRGVCGDGGRHQCPVCTELFDSREDLPITLLHCRHTLCHHCTAGIMSRARNPGRLQCPLCRQTTPYPQWEIRRLQEESYSSSAYEPGPDPLVVPAPEPEAGPAAPLCCFTRCMLPSVLVRGLRLVQRHPLCFSISVLLLLLLVAPRLLLPLLFPKR